MWLTDRDFYGPLLVVAVVGWAFIEGLDYILGWAFQHITISLK